MGNLSARRSEEMAPPKYDWQSWFVHHPLRTATAQQLFSQYPRVVILAPHPNDEVMGCAGILMMLEKLRIPCVVVFVSDGATSHVDTATVSARQYADTHMPTSSTALSMLAPSAQLRRLSIPDGSISRARNRLYHQLSHCIDEHDLMICPWEYDGHPDNEAVADVALELAQLKKISVIRIPIVTWDWCSPDNQGIPWEHACALPLDANMQAKKAAAMAVFNQQRMVNAATAKAPILPPHVLTPFLRSFELVFL